MNAPKIQAVPPDPSQVAWLNEQRTQAIHFAKSIAGLSVSTVPSLAQLHATYDAWYRSASCGSFVGKLFKRSRVSTDQIVAAIGVGLGDDIVKRTALEWRLITDAYGTELGLFAAASDGEHSHVVFHPMSFVAKRIESGAIDWLEPTAGSVIEQLNDVLRST